MGLIKDLFTGNNEERPLDATKLLEQQHREVTALFGNIEAAEGAEKESLVRELAARLVGHSVIEKEHLYAEMMPSDTKSIREAIEEHAIVEGLLYKIVRAKVTDPTLDAKLTVLKELIEHHVEEEEKELFKKARAELGDERLVELGADMERRFAQIEASDFLGMLERSVAEQAPMPVVSAASKPKRTVRRAAGATPRSAPARAMAKRQGSSARTRGKAPSSSKRGAPARRRSRGKPSRA